MVHWLCGFRQAAQAWENHYARKMEDVGFVRGIGTSVAFQHPERDLACAVHGDDFTFSGEDKDLDWAESLMKSWFEVVVRARLGPEEKDDKEISVLGRIVKVEDWSFSYQADPRHRMVILESFGLVEGSKGFTTIGRVEKENTEAEFPAVGTRLNFIAQDCPDLQFPSKEASREMSRPTNLSWNKTKRLARYLLSRPSAVFRYEWMESDPVLVVFTDSDWAGCRRTRKSTS